jgi:hypothetical protein
VLGGCVNKGVAVRGVIAVVFLLNFGFAMFNFGTLPIKTWERMSDGERYTLVWNIALSFFSFLLAMMVVLDGYRLAKSEKE